MKDPQDLDEPCRLCMGRTGPSGVGVVNNLDLIQKVHYAVGIKVKETDKYRTICKECTESVSSCYDFKLLCQKTQKEFNPQSQNEDERITGRTEPRSELPTTHTQWSKNGIGGMVVWSTMNQNGQIVPVQAMVPVGPPIPFNVHMPLYSHVLPPGNFETHGKLLQPKQEPVSDHETGPEHEPISVSHQEQKFFDSDDDAVLRDVLDQIKTDDEESDEEVKSHEKIGPKCSKSSNDKDLKNVSLRVLRRRTKPGPKSTKTTTPSIRPKRNCVLKIKTLIDPSDESSDSEDEEISCNEDNSECEKQKKPEDKKNTPDCKPSEHSQRNSSEAGVEILDENLSNYIDPLKCKICSRTFRSEVYLDCHMKTHRNIDKFPCIKCENRFPSRSDLEMHEDEKHSDETWECSPCFVAFSSVSTWRAHLKRHKSTAHDILETQWSDEERTDFSRRSRKSMKCKKRFVSSCLNEEKVDDPPEIDKSLNKAIKSSESKTVHSHLSEKKVDKPSSHAVQQCLKRQRLKKSTSVKAVNEHITVNIKLEEPYHYCKVCKQQFRDESALTCHEANHKHKALTEKKSKNFECRFCNQVFVSISDRICHEEIAHPR